VAARRFVDNLQTVPTHTLKSLQQLPPHLRQFLTRNLISAPPGGSGPGTLSGAATGGPGLRPAQSAGNIVGAAAAAGAALAVSAQGGGPHAAAAAAATAATTVLLSPRRRAAAAAEAAGEVLVQQQRPPIPRPSLASSRGLREPRTAEDRQPLLGGAPLDDSQRQPLLQADCEAGAGPEKAGRHAAATVPGASAARTPAVGSCNDGPAQQRQAAAGRPGPQAGAGSNRAASASALPTGSEAQPQPPPSPFESSSAEGSTGAGVQQPGGDNLV
jgi:hypothetical protein